MKTSGLLIMTLLIWGLINCKSQNKPELQKEKYPIEITENIKKIKDLGWGYRFYLKDPQVINGYPVKDGIQMAYDGTKMLFVLAEDYIINDDLIPADSRLRMYSKGKPLAYDLSQSTWIQGYHVGTEKIYGNGSSIEFYEHNGHIKWFMPETNNIINRIPCLANKSIKLYSSGEVHVCTLSEELEYKGKTYPVNSILLFDVNGNVNQVSGHNIGQSHLPWRIQFYDDGNPKEIMLIENSLFYGIPCMRNYTIHFYPNGKLKQCVLYKNVTIDGVEFKKGDKLKFDKNGKVQPDN